MNWTDERVEKLKRLWAEGLSASQIAAELGGVSRNAVIGKAHRLNLAVRSKAGRPRASNAPRAPRTHKASKPPAAARQWRVPDREDRESANPFAVLAKSPRVPETETPAEMQQSRFIVPVSRRLVLTELTDHTCKWPVGDPLKDDFFFCGVGTEGTYCDYHAKIAYQPVSERRSSKPAATTFDYA